MSAPTGSLYLWMYRQGLRRRPIDDVAMELALMGRVLRPKDVENYWNGWYRYELYQSGSMPAVSPRARRYSELPKMETPSNEPGNRFVPCSKDNKPMIKWGGGCMTEVDARSMLGSRYLAENLKGCRHIVIDCDRDHGDRLHWDVIDHLWKYTKVTSALFKPKFAWEYEGAEPHDGWAVKIPSFHLTFSVDRWVPTMHFENVDVIGNAVNSLRYFKNKIPNDLEPLPMTDEIWEDIVLWAERRTK